MAILKISILSFTLLLSFRVVYALGSNDGHIHYNEDVWSALPPENALRMLDINSINRAIVSSTPSEGTKKLYRLAPDRIIPFLPPYHIDQERATWHSDQKILDYVTEELQTGFYKGFGEFHLYSENKDTAIVRQIMQFVADYKMSVLAHADKETIATLIIMQPEVNIIWAHCGFDYPVLEIKRMLEEYPKLLCELSFREGLTDEQGQLKPVWKALLEDNASQFIIGMDTYIPQRWANLSENKEYAISWLVQLDAHAAALIARENIDRLFPP